MKNMKRYNVYREKAGEANVCQLKDIEAVIEDIGGFPCVIKSTIDLFQPIEMHTFAEFEEFMDEKISLLDETDLLIEEFIDGYDCTVAVACNGEEIKNYGVTYYSKAKEYGLKGFDKAKIKHFDR